METKQKVYIDKVNSDRVSLGRTLFTIEYQALEILGNEFTADEYVEKFHTVLLDLISRGHEKMEASYGDDVEPSMQYLFRELRRSERFSLTDMLLVGIEQDSSLPATDDFEPYQLFAGLALVLVNEVPSEIAHPEIEDRLTIDENANETICDGKFEPLPDVIDVLKVAVQVAEGMAAVHIAERLFGQKHFPALSSIEEEVTRRISDRARASAIARNRENHEMRTQIFEWCDANVRHGQSMSNAAQTISQNKIIPLTPQVIYKYTREWKKLRSANQE